MMSEASQRSDYMPLSGAASGRPSMINLVPRTKHRQILLTTSLRPKSNVLHLMSPFHATRGHNLGLGDNGCVGNNMITSFKKPEGGELWTGRRSKRIISAISAVVACTFRNRLNNPRSG
jgi:hypothetical protein